MADRNKSDALPLLPPTPDAWTISKKQVVCTELATAIRLFFSGEDFISAHVLGSAARDILRDIAKKNGVETLWNRMKVGIAEEHQDAFAARISDEYNFFKHGAKDAETTSNRYKPRLTAMILMEACVDFAEVFGENYTETATFLIWHFNQFPHLVNDEYGKLKAEEGIILGLRENMSFEDSLRVMSLFLKDAERLSRETGRDLKLLYRASERPIDRKEYHHIR